MNVRRKLLANIRRADYDFGLINKGDNIMVGVSGGKDSLVLLYMLKQFQKFSDKDFTFMGVMLDLGFPKSDLGPLLDFVNKYEIPFKVADASTVYPILLQHMKNDRLPCSICSRMKKAAINAVANELGFKKVAFAHHGDDAIETLLMNMTHGGRLATFAPKMFLERAKIEFIRPLIYCREQDILSFSNDLILPVIESTCSNNHITERAVFKKILSDHYQRFPDSYNNFMTMLTNSEKAALWFDLKGNSNGQGVFIKKVTTSKDMISAMMIRQKVFIEDQQIDAKDEFDGSDYNCESYLLTLNDVPIGTLRTEKIGDEEVHITRFAIQKEYQKQGYGSQLLHYVEKNISQEKAPITVTLNAQVSVKNFYLNRSYISEGEVFLEAGINHIKMSKKILKPIMDKEKVL